MLNYFERQLACAVTRYAEENDMMRLAEMEYNSYPEDESASYDRMCMRQRLANDYFVVLDIGNNVIGFVNGTCSKSDVIAHESMGEHDSDGQHLIIHSVVIKHEFRCQGYARFMLKAYMDKIREHTNINRVSLLSKDKLLGFYSSCGFNVLRISPIEHGKVSSLV